MGGVYYSSTIYLAFVLDQLGEELHVEGVCLPSGLSAELQRLLVELDCWLLAILDVDGHENLLGALRPGYGRGVGRHFGSCDWGYVEKAECDRPISKDRELFRSTRKIDELELVSLWRVSCYHLNEFTR